MTQPCRRQVTFTGIREEISKDLGRVVGVSVVCRRECSAIYCPLKKGVTKVSVPGESVVSFAVSQEEKARALAPAIVEAVDETVGKTCDKFRK